MLYLRKPQRHRMPTAKKNHKSRVRRTARTTIVHQPPRRTTKRSSGKIQSWDGNITRLRNDAHLAVSLFNLGIITSPCRWLSGGSCVSLMGRGSDFSTPPSPNSWPVHGSMYVREGGCTNTSIVRISYFNVSINEITPDFLHHAPERLPQQGMILRTGISCYQL